MSAEWQLSPHAFLACLDGDAVFLDLRAETYACLPQMAAEVVPLVAGRAASLIPEVAGELRAHGLIEFARSDDPRPRESIPPRPILSLMPGMTEGLAMRDLRPLLGALIDLASVYHGRTLSQIIAIVRRSRSKCSRNCTTLIDVGEVVSGFTRWLPFAPLPPKCLLRSYLLLRILHRHGLDAKWVFGVTTWPFRAHCWLQVGEVVLDDDVDRVIGFEPIMAV